MNRTNQSTRTTKVDVATHLGANVQFNYSLETGQVLPTQVSATDYLTGGGMVNVSITIANGVAKPNETYANGATGSEHGALAAAIVAECKTILGIEEEA